ncbi:MAG: hypothetical protein ABIM64_04095 [candidate division WOR-3 bacterium]
MDDSMMRRMWYTNNEVRFEICKALRKKELQIIGEGISIRWLNCQFVKILDSIIDHLNIEKRASSFYMSLDNYSSIPLMSFNLHKRQEQYKEWSQIRKNRVIGSDFGLDLDCKKGSYKDVIQDAQKIIDLFDSYNVKYCFWMSGSHGFHFIIPYEDLPQDVKNLTNTKLLAFYKRFAEILAEKVKSIDLSIYMPTRVLKCPYTLEKHGRVILPLDKYTWQKLKENNLQFNPLWILKNIKIRDRGVYLQGSSEGIKNLIKNWEGW